MKISELLQRTPEKVSRDLSYLFGSTCFVPEALDHAGYVAVDLVPPGESDRIEVRVFKEHNFDYRRIWRLAAVYLDGEPVMVIQNAGREGDDYARRFIVDRERYYQLVQAIQMIPRSRKEEMEDLYSMEDDIEKLTTFYGASLDQGHWERY